MEYVLSKLELYSFLFLYSIVSYVIGVVDTFPPKGFFCLWIGILFVLVLYEIIERRLKK